MKKVKFLLFVFLMVGILSGCHRQHQAKYVFFFIGDGMGVGQRTVTEMYQSALNGEIGQTQLLMDSLPIQGLITTYAENSYITCSAAAGTALSTGVKTKNGMLGMSPDTVVLQTIAEKAKLQGKAVGIITTVALNHATPGAFYAHQPYRAEFEQINDWMIKSNFDYFAGGQAYLKDKVKQNNFITELEKAGYFVADSRDKMNQMQQEQNKWVLIGDDLDESNGSIKYVMDRKEKAIGLVDMLQKAIDLLYPKEKGFFIMIEGGKIDFASHLNDGASMIHEVLELDNAVRVAMNFYQQHPEETLILVAADHETGGLSCGNRSMKYKMSLETLSNQKHSLDDMIKNQQSFMSKKKEGEDIYQFAKMLGMSQPLVLKNGKDSLEIKNAYQDYIENHDSEELMRAVIGILNKRAGLGWTTDKHTGNPVPISAIGVGAELFVGIYDNTEVPKRIAKIMKLE